MRLKQLAVGAGVVMALGAGLGFFWPFGGGKEMLRLSGVVEVREVRLGSKIGGRIASVLVEEGELIKPGQLLLRLEAPELKAQAEQWQARLASAEAAELKARNGPRQQEKDAALAALRVAEAKLQRIRFGDREEDKRGARADLASAQADLRLANEEFARTERSFRQGAAARAEYDTARSAVERNKARVANARARLDRTERGRQEEVAEAEQEVKRLTAEHDLLKEGTRYEDKLQAKANVDEMRGRLRELQANLAEAEVRAPGNSRDDPQWRALVEVVAVRRGDLVAPNQPLLRILQANDLWVKVYVPETDLGKVRLGQEVEVTVDSHPGKRFKGKVMHIAGESEFTPRNVQSADERRNQMFGLKVRVDDPQGVFKSGMAAEVLVPLGSQ